MPLIFIVEDDDAIREMLAYALGSAGFDALGFSSGGELFSHMKSAAPALVLLDVMLPGQDGIHILKTLRESEKWARLPVIMLTAKSAEIDRVKGLDGGADDYITKPFSVLEVISRVRAVLRRSAGAPEKELAAGALRLSAAKRAVSAGGESVALTYKEFELLHYLMINAGLVLTRDKIIGQVWGFDYSGESRTVDMHIKTLRQKLGACGEMIKTVRNVGYKLENP